MTWMLVALFAQSDVQDLVKQLGDESPEVREFAEAELFKRGADAAAALKQALDTSDMEQRVRIEELLLRIEFDGSLTDLDGEDRRIWHAAARKLLETGSRARPALRRAAGGAKQPLAFRAGQIADILETAPTGGLRVGIIVEKPESKIEEGVSGVVVWLNAGKERIIVETKVDPRVSLCEGDEMSVRHGGSGRHPRTRTSACATLEAGRAHLKPRDDVLRSYDQYGSSQWNSPTGPGSWSLVPTYAFESLEKGAWTGSVTGNRVVVVFKEGR